MTEYSEQQEFLKKLSHKLRNPLGTILGYAEVLLLNTELSEEEQDMLTAIKDNCKKMNTILMQVNDEHDRLDNSEKK